jgi:Ca-activated chloride channel family protein
VSRQNVRLIFAIIALVVIVKVLQRDRTEPSESSGRVDRATRELQQINAQLMPPESAPKTTSEGLAAAIVIDVSGSMNDKVAGRDGRREEKIAIARRAAIDLVAQFASYAGDHPTEPVQLGVYEFSRRRGDPDCRPVIPMGPPDRARAANAIAGLSADGGTPIGQAMITAKLALDSTGLSRRHLLVVTDGENTDGVAPDRVATAINKRPDMERPAIYFVAFDVEASRFSSVRDAGGFILSAANATELNDTLDALLRGKILVEK